MDFELPFTFLQTSLARQTPSSPKMLRHLRFLAKEKISKKENIKSTFHVIFFANGDAEHNFAVLSKLRLLSLN